ncbi:uncharacterized protein [Bombus fervidus]|uniref:uncharacterized protein n=1 Tax=Bombus fervidus TaxID=203811 RepID=UPI003D18C066
MTSKRKRDVLSVTWKGKILQKLEEKCGGVAKIAKVYSIRRSMINDIKNRKKQVNDNKSAIKESVSRYAGCYRTYVILDLIAHLKTAKGAHTNVWSISNKYIVYLHNLLEMLKY